MSENMIPETGNVVPEISKIENGFGEPEMIKSSATEAELNSVNKTADENVQTASLETVKPQPSYYQYNPQNHTYVEPEQPKGSGLAIAGMVCGIVALVSVCCLWPLSIVLGIVGLVLSIIGLCKKQSKGMSIAGIVTSGLGIFLGIVLGILSAIFMTAITEAYKETYQDYLNYELFYDDYYDEYYDYEYFMSEKLGEL